MSPIEEVTSMRRLLVAISVALLGCATAVPLSAQQAPAEILPDATAIGSGWTQVATLPAVENLDPSFSDSATAIYGGPNGARAIITIFTVAEGMTAIRQSWEVGNDVFDFYRQNVDYGFQSSREEELAAQPLPDGCADARRLYAVDELGVQQFPVGLTLCAADPNVLVMAYASGEIAGRSGSEASDALVSLALAGETSPPGADE
jgi:hypothetical protein